MTEDEGFSEKSNSLNFYEFIESISRAAEKLALMPIGVYDVFYFFLIIKFLY